MPNNNDKNLMENMLLLEKGVCDLFLHGAIESSTANVHQTFNSALNNSLSIQDNIYNKMSAKGWYAPEQAEQNQNNTVKKKFCCGQAQG